MSFGTNKFKERVFTLHSIGLLYILVVGGLCHILPIPEIVKGFLALPGLLIMPYLVGKTTSIFIEKFLRIDLSFDAISNFIVCWCIGIITMIIIVYFLNYLWLFEAQSYVILILFLMIPSIFYMKKQEHLKRVIKTYGGHTAIFFSLVLGIVGFFFITYFSPYPYQSGCDYQTHSYYSTLIIEKNFIYMPSTYLISFHILVSNNVQIFNISDEPLIFWWAMQFIFYLVYAFGLYLFSYQISKNKILSLISIIIGVFTFHHFYGPIYLFEPAPKAIILILFPYLLFVVHNLITQKKISNEFEIKKLIKHILFITVVSTFLFLILNWFFRWSFRSNFIYLGQSDNIGIILLIFIILLLLILKYGFKNMVDRKFLFLLLSLMFVSLFFHTSMGFFMCLFIILYVLYLILIEKYPSVMKYLGYFLVLFVFLYFVLQEKGILEFQSPITLYGSIVNPTLLGFQNMKNFLGTLYSPTVIGLFILGCIYSIFYNKKQHFSLLFLVLIIFIFIFSPIDMIFRLMVFLHPIMAYFVAYGLITTGQILFTNRTHSIYNKHSIITSFMVVVLLLSVVENSMNEIYQVLSIKGGELSCLHSSLYDVANTLKHNTPYNTLILYYSTNLDYLQICGLANRPHVSYMADNLSHECVKNIFTAQNSLESYKKIYYLLTTNDSSCKCYLGGVDIGGYQLRPERYNYEIERMRNSSVAVLITRHDLNALSPEAVNKFYNLVYFTLIYNDTQNGIYIFGVNPEPGVPFKIQNNLK